MKGVLGVKVRQTYQLASGLCNDGVSVIVSKGRDVQYAGRFWSETKQFPEAKFDSFRTQDGFLRSLWRLASSNTTTRKCELYTLHIGSLPLIAVLDTLSRLGREVGAFDE